MRLGRHFLTLVLAGVATGCSLAPQFDSCSRIREFKQFNWKSGAYRSLPVVDVPALQPEVNAAVNAFSRRLAGDESFFIVEARQSGPYILLEISQACFDCKRWVVYSTDRRCIVGTFTLGMQG